MARRLKLYEHKGKDGDRYWAVRFTVKGQRFYETFGSGRRADAERWRDGIAAALDEGTWRPKALREGDAATRIAARAAVIWEARQDAEQLDAIENESVSLLAEVGVARQRLSCARETAEWWIPTPLAAVGGRITQALQSRAPTGLTWSEARAYEFLTAQGLHVLRNGWPDFLVVGGHGVIAVEVKSGGARLTAEQRVIAEVLHEIGLGTLLLWVDGDGRVFAVTDQGLQEDAAVLDRFNAIVSPQPTSS